MRIPNRVRGVLLVGAVLAAGALAAPSWSADHKDAPATIADPAADINDVFSFVDSGRIVLGMTVTPFAGAGAVFSNATQYVFHTSSGAAFGTTTANEDIICTFDASQNISCWAGTDDYVTGNASNSATPLTSASGKMIVFAGMRSDPFFFNLQGFKDAVSTVESVASSLTFDTSGCPTVPSSDVAALGGLLSETTSTAAPSKTTADDFATANTLAIVVSLDPSLVTAGGKIMSVWGATYASP